MSSAPHLKAHADYSVTEAFEVETEDREDHTFSGIMFTIECRADFPVEFVEVFKNEFAAAVHETRIDIGFRLLVEYNFECSPADGTCPGIDHILDVAYSYAGYPLFRDVKTLVSFVDEAVAATNNHLGTAVRKKGNLHWAVRGEQRNIDSCVITPHEYL